MHAGCSNSTWAGLLCNEEWPTVHFANPSLHGGVTMAAISSEQCLQVAGADGIGRNQGSSQGDGIMEERVGMGLEEIKGQVKGKGLWDGIGRYQGSSQGEGVMKEQHTSRRGASLTMLPSTFSSSSQRQRLAGSFSAAVHRSRRMRDPWNASRPACACNSSRLELQG